MAATDNRNDWIKEAEQVYKKAMETNKQLLADTSAAMGRIFSVGAKKEESPNGGDFGKLMGDWYKINLRYTESLINLGLDWSKSMAELLQPKKTEAASSNETPTASKAPNAASAQGRQEIVMAANPGETVATSLHLQNSHPVAQSGRLDATKFRQEGTGWFSQIGLSFEPQQFEIPAGQSVPVVLAMKVPDNTTPANYRCKVVVHGFDDAEFDLVLQVNELVEEPVATTQKTATKKKSPTKKAKG